MILSITPHPAIDETYLSTGLQPNASHRATLAHRQAGGKGTNVARVLDAQGLNVTALCPLGGASGAEFSTELQSTGVRLQQVQVAVHTRRSMAFHSELSNETTIFNEVGSALTAVEWDHVASAVNGQLASARAVTICGSWPPQTPASVSSGIIRSATSAGLWTLVDTSGPNLLEAAACGAVLKPNEHELRAATGCDSLNQGAAKLLALGASEVYLSVGERGLFHFTHETPHVAHARLNRILEGNPTGAGDSAVAALASSRIQGLDREATLRRAVAWSASTLLMPTAGVLSPEHVALEASVDYRIISELEHI